MTVRNLSTERYGAVKLKRYNTVFKRDEVILLLGAGASVEAGIPDSNEMVRRVEALIRDNDDWKGYESLYAIKKTVGFWQS